MDFVPIYLKDSFSLSFSRLVWTLILQTHHFSTGPKGLLSPNCANLYQEGGLIQASLFRGGDLYGLVSEHWDWGQ